MTNCEELSTDGSPGGGSGTVGVVDDSALFVSITDAKNYEYFMHQLGDFDKDCAIKPTATADGDISIQCVVDVPEEDLNFNPVTLLLNVPRNMCHYVTKRAYWFENWRIETGPATVDVSVNTGTGAVVVNVGTANATTGAAECAYDYSLTDSDYPNCCLGAYSYILRSTTGATTTVTTTTQEWGGDISSCIAGPGTYLDPKNRAGYPVGTLQYVEEDGLSEAIEILSPMSTLSPNIMTANYQEGLESGTTPTPVSRGQQSYEYECLDRAHEVLGRILVYIREWNEYSEFIKKDSGDPDSSGFEGFPPGTYDVNDHDDWGDYGATTWPNLLF